MYVVNVVMLYLLWYNINRERGCYEIDEKIEIL